MANWREDIEFKPFRYFFIYPDLHEKRKWETFQRFDYLAWRRDNNLRHLQLAATDSDTLWSYTVKRARLFLRQLRTLPIHFAVTM